MLTKIQFENYRCFEKNSITCKEMMILVGKNNAGKSTIIEALRMVAYATRKAAHTTYRTLPLSFNLGIRTKGLRIDAERLKIDLRSIVYLYEDKTAKVTAFFDNNCKIVVLATPDDAYAIIYDPNDNIINTKNKAMTFNFDNSIAILPQIGLIKEKEKLLEVKTVDEHRDTYLSSRHFRNEVLLYKDDYWRDFQTMAESSWENLSIKSLDYDYGSFDSDYILLMVSENHFLAEIGLMGSGLQMWLQIIWFICRSKEYDTIILDEPDVYMHPDLQLKLLSITKKLNKQVIIATHSIEIISEAPPNNIIMVDKKISNMKYANNLKAVQNMVDNIGGIQNLSLIRIGLKKKCLFVEGHDIYLLSKFYQHLYPERENIFSDLPIVEIKGFANLSEAFGTSKLFYLETNNTIKSMCILDRDYYCDELLQKKQNRATDNHLELHIWNKKELENYLIILPTLYRLTNQKIEYDVFLEEIEKLVDVYKSKVESQIFAHLQEYHRSLDISTLFQQTNTFMEQNWNSLDSKINIAPGKELLKDIMSWFQEQLKISITTKKIINASSPEEIDAELINVLNQIECL